MRHFKGAGLHPDLLAFRLKQAEKSPAVRVAKLEARFKELDAMSKKAGFKNLEDAIGAMKAK